jgi:hypothetical protein
MFEVRDGLVHAKEMSLATTELRSPHELREHGLNTALDDIYSMQISPPLHQL